MRWPLLGLAALALACGSPPTPPSSPPDEAVEAPADPRQPRVAIVEAMREDLAAVRHPSDGGGRAWIESGRQPATSGVPGTWSLIFEVGAEGIADGGQVFLQISPFWGWSEPQVDRPGAPGFTTVEWVSGDSDDTAPSLSAQVVDSQLLAATVAGRSLRPGERLRFVFGGDAGALPDRFAERGERFWIAVDGDGDGIRGLLAESPRLDIGPGPAARLVATLPSTARPGETVRLHLAWLDRWGNAGVEVTGEVSLDAVGESDLGVDLEPVRFTPSDRGVRVVELTPTQSGVLRLEAVADNGLVATTNPLQVATGSLRVYWLDVQNHSNVSDGTGRPEDLYRYARDVAGLDIVSVTDHDHWGLRFLDRDEATWAGIQASTEAFHEPGRFVTVRGYEWTNWIHGHRHVLVFDAQPLPIYSSIDPAFDHPDELWAALRGRSAITIAHHSAGGPIATDWTIAPDPVLEPITEIVSVHGSSEAEDAPRLIHRPVHGNFVRGAALGRGYRLGFIGSSDGHDGHPGLGHLASGTGGLGAIVSAADPDEALTREAVYLALVERSTYATSGPRILLRAVYGGYRMGAEVPIDDGRAADGPGRQVELVPEDHLFVQALAAEPLERIDIIRRDRPPLAVDCGQQLDCLDLRPIDDLAPQDWLYVRVVQRDGHVAVSSPFFFVAHDGEAIGAPAAESE